MRGVERAELALEEDPRLSYGEYVGFPRESTEEVRERRDELRELEALLAAADDAPLGGLPTPRPPREDMAVKEVSALNDY
jgi:hypothetical protein